MEEIKVGDWVRIVGGYIDQIQEIKLIHTDDGDQMGYKLKKMWFLFYVAKDYIVKHSRNIIYVIEVGDFVNGFPILEPIYNGNVMYGVDEGYENFKKSFGEIKTVLTHEQYKEHCIKVGEE